MDEMRRKSLKTWFAQAVKFGLVGVVNTLIDLAVFALLTLIPFFANHFALAKGISYGCGVVNSLLMNRKFTFRDKRRFTPVRLGLFLLVNAAAWGVSVGVIALIKPTDLPLNLCNVIATAFSLVVNFLGSKLIVFRSTDG